MKKKFSIVAFIFILSIYFAAVPGGTFLSAGDTGVLLAQENIDFVSMCRQYFKNMLDRRYIEVWNLTTSSSQHLIAKLIAEKTEGKASEQEVMNMLNADSNRVRSIYFDEFVKEAPIKKIYEMGIFALKSAGADEGTVTITMDDEPLDCKILKENGLFKIDFFSDLFQ